MARSHAKFLCSARRDPAWLALTLDAQWLYWTLLTDPRLSLVGSLDVAAGKWVHLSAKTDRDRIEDALWELRSARFVHVDDGTDELLIRSFTTHDLNPNRMNVNLCRGLWGHWGAISSHRIRQAAVENMPAEIWAKLEPHAPADAVQIRRSAQLEPDDDSQFEPDEEPRFEPPSALLPSPVTGLPTDDALPVRADFDHPPVPKIDPHQQDSLRNGIALVKTELQTRGRAS